MALECWLGCFVGECLWFLCGSLNYTASMRHVLGLHRIHATCTSFAFLSRLFLLLSFGYVFLPSPFFLCGSGRWLQLYLADSHQRISASSSPSFSRPLTSCVVVGIAGSTPVNNQVWRGSTPLTPRFFCSIVSPLFNQDKLACNTDRSPCSTRSRPRHWRLYYGIHLTGRAKAGRTASRSDR